MTLAKRKKRGGIAEPNVPTAPAAATTPTKLLKSGKRSQPADSLDQADLPLGLPSGLSSSLPSELPSTLPAEVAPRLKATALAHAGLSPLEVMLKVMHELIVAADAATHGSGDLFGDTSVSESRIKLLNMAAAVGRHVAPYVHPRLSAIEHTGKDGAPLLGGVLLVPAVLSADEWERCALDKSQRQV